MALRRRKTEPKRTTHEQKLRALSRRGIVVDPSSRSGTAHAYNKYIRKRVPHELERPVTSKDTRSELKRHGFRVTDKGVIIDGPRNTRREKIPGAKVEVQKGGVIKTSVGQRRDFIYGFTKKEKREFARDPESFILKKLRELRERIPTLKGKRIDVLQRATRLQWGAFQAQKDFSPNYFTARYFATVSPEEITKVGKKRAKPRADKLTGIHIVVHVPKTTRGKRAKGKTKGRKRK